MRTHALTALLFAAALPLVSCSNNTNPQPQTGKISVRPKNEILECQMRTTTSMAGEAITPKIATLWIDSFRKTVLRADTLATGGVMRHGYSSTEATLTPALKQQLVDRGIETEWGSAYRFHHYDTDKLVLTKADESRGLLLTYDGENLAERGGERSALECARIDRGVAPANVVLVEAPPQPKPKTVGCADNTVEETFGATMVGCTGSVTFANRQTLCGVGWTVCSAAQWVARSANRAPQFIYWTNDDLFYSGTGPNNCTVSTTVGSSCAPNPMRVCSDTSDSIGGRCNWTGCGLDSTSNHYFGGCGHNTGSALCCQ